MPKRRSSVSWARPRQRSSAVALRSRLMDPTGSRAILVGASTYGVAAELDDLPSVPAGIAELRRLLVAPESGSLESTACRTIIDPETPNEVDEELWRCAAE